MAGALWTGYDASFPAIWVEAMKRRRRAGTRPAKSRPSKSLKLKRHAVPKAAAGRSSAMQELAGWLEKLGMSEYVQRFAENDIDIAVLRHLTDQDLKELGVSLGHRRKMQAAIAELAGAAPATPQVVAEPKSQDTAERRQVTVMFADLVGSTALARSYGP